MFSPELAVVITTNNRPHYLIDVIRSWEKTSWRDFPLFFQCEPDNPQVVDICHTVRHAWVKVNEIHQGPLGNPWHAIESGFATGAEFVVLGEDDSVVAPDILGFFLKAKRKYMDFKKVFAVCSFVREPLGEPNEFCYQPNFASVIWGIWRNRWEEELREHWGWDYSDAWDGKIINRLNGRACVFPGWSRSQHIGKFDGAHMMPTMYDALKSKCFYTEGKDEEWMR